ncbi:hypothetical protein SY88_19860 [Clostridiales bacterium PH28_bin88]|nr:hypothetical protein SY88_19860 [Clostridiales bacterium PH28_bin88]
MVRALFVCLVLAIVTLTLFNRYVYRGFGMQVDVLRRGTPDFKVVALTFDDGPDIRYTPQILDILKKYDAKATFFLVGKHVEEHPQIARRIVQEGHEVGNHTYSHYNMLKASPARQVEELTRAEAVIKNATGERTSLFRPPRGLYDANLQGPLHDRGYSLVLWSVTSGDWLEISSRDIVNNILKRAGPGDVLLFHDSGNLISGGGGNRLNTVQALPHLLEELKREGYTFVTMTQLMIISGLTGGE